MEHFDTIYADFGSVPCGQKATQTVKVKNKSKRVRVLAVSNRFKNAELQTERLRIQPTEVLAKPGQTVYFALTYISYVDNVTENHYYDILNSREVVARLKIHARSIGPSITPTVYNLKFFRVRGLDDTVRHVDLTNSSKCEAKFFFDLDEDFEQVEISQRTGVIPANHRLALKLTFKPLVSGIFHKKIFCIVQFHSPIIFNILAIYQPKAKIEVKDLIFRHPPEPSFVNNYETYMARVKVERHLEGEKICLSQKLSQEFQTSLKGITSQNSADLVDQRASTEQTSDSLSETESKLLAEDIVLTNSYLNIKNVREVRRATALVNLSRTQLFYYEWDEDIKNHFQVCPCRGLIKPNSRTYFTINFTPSALDFIYHVELDVRVFACPKETETESPHVVDWPLTFSLRIIGGSTPALMPWSPELQSVIVNLEIWKDLLLRQIHETLKRSFDRRPRIRNLFRETICCGWMPQCKTEPKRLYLRPCVPGEIVCGTFIIERQGHLPVNFVVVPQREQNFIVQPTLGYLSKSFQLLFVRFSSHSKEPGVYREDLKIIFNDSDSCAETIKLCVCVEIPTLVLGSDNSVTFPAVAPGSKASKSVAIENPTHLYLRYEFVIPTDITWIEIKDPKGSIEPRASGEVVVTYQPGEPSEYLDYIPCFVSSISEMECTQTVYLRTIGSCQFGCLAATPSIYDFGKCIFGESKTVKIHLFNFSELSVNFQLSPAPGVLPFGNPHRDVTVMPRTGTLPGKESMEIQVKIKAHGIGPFHYEIECQIVNENYEKGCENPRRIISIEYEGVLQITRVVSVSVNNGGPLFSPHWLWKMLDADGLNQALRSVTMRHTIRVSVPERTQDSPPIIVSVLFEADAYGDVIWNYRVEVNCPCLEGSTRTFSEGLECVHTKAVFVPPTPHKLSPRSRLIAQITLKYDEISECEVCIVIGSHRKSVTLKIPVTVLPADKPSHLSFFSDGPFTLKPIFIGDPHPPLQLFWIYNNTKNPTPYILNREALRQCTDPERSVFDCFNPCGIVPPFSTLPLAFLFRPNSPKEYQAVATVCFEDSKSKCIKLRGKGVLNVNQFQELTLEKSVPSDRIISNESVECCESCINIPFIRVFSHTTRLFFLKNTSRKQKWAFQWHSFHTEYVFNARVQPEKGVLEPEQRLLMTLYIQTFCHPTTVTASVPCDVINHSQLEEYLQSKEIQKITERNLRDCFTITEKGVTRETATIPIVQKPETHHTFLTVNVNIIGSLNIDLKLTPKQQSILGAESEMRIEETVKCPLKSATLKSNQQFLEKLFWNILSSHSVAQNVKNLKNTQDYFYLQLKSETKKTREESLEFLRIVPKKSNIQRFLEAMLQEVLSKHFIPQASLTNSYG